MPTIRVVQGDITQQTTDAIVNAANSSLLGGGGVDGAIHRAAGPELLEACRRLGGCPVGEARITHGYQLPARWVIHTVGPVWSGGGRGESGRLQACYEAVLELAEAHGIHSIAFPSISTGTFGYPIALASRVAVATVRDMLAQPTRVETVQFVCFTRDDLAAYEEVLAS